ncbi:hypothetical protein [Micromonospora sp. NBC_00858]|uniref:hypothetical protein n=1 Tax=Micromonospora sp. NBC_00858 TaxID=2975979 RepID=UPI003865F0BC|nr:hypothetical protein OG990_28080 [Micromonospora sp. NBC_00858]
MRLDRKTAKQVIGASLLFVTAVLCCIAAWAVGNAPRSGPERPKVTDWMQAWGSIAGVFAGLAAAGAAGALLIHERQQAREAREQLAEDRRSADESRARQVITAGLRFDTVDGHLTCAYMDIYNFGKEPIHSVVATVLLPRHREVAAGGVEFVPPGERITVTIPFNPPQPCLGPFPEMEQQLSKALISFIDSSGWYWERINNERPKRSRIESGGFGNRQRRAGGMD